MIHASWMADKDNLLTIVSKLTLFLTENANEVHQIHILMFIL